MWEIVLQTAWENISVRLWNMHPSTKIAIVWISVRHKSKAPGWYEKLKTTKISMQPFNTQHFSEGRRGSCHREGCAAVPSLFDGCYEVRSWEHGEQAVPIGRGGLIAGAGRVPLIGRPAAVHSIPGHMTEGSTVSFTPSFIPHCVPFWTHCLMAQHQY